MKLKLFYLLIPALVILLASCQTDDLQELEALAGRPFTVELSGAAEVPGPGDPDGSGTASFTLNQGQGLICYEISVSDILLPARGAHIHVGDVDEAGPVVVPLVPPDEDGFSSGCAEVDKELVKAIRQNPEAYYVNVHTNDFPAGAVRGQLSK